MDGEEISRRLLLRAIAAALGAAALPVGWAEIVDVAAQASGDAKLSFFSAPDAADVEAVAAQIIPTDDTPGAREAGAIYFIDRVSRHFCRTSPSTIARRDDLANARYLQDRGVEI